jgi:hypothetical protein
MAGLPKPRRIITVIANACAAASATPALKLCPIMNLVSRAAAPCTSSAMSALRLSSNSTRNCSRSAKPCAVRQ